VKANRPQTNLVVARDSSLVKCALLKKTS